MVREVHRDSIEAIGDGRAVGATGLIVWSEHEMIDQKLRAPAEEVCERRAPFVRFEPIVFVDSHPRQFLPVTSYLISSVRQVFFFHKQLLPCRNPLLSTHDLVFHCLVSLLK
jgi:hypothetical protein